MNEHGRGGTRRKPDGLDEVANNVRTHICNHEVSWLDVGWFFHELYRADISIWIAAAQGIVCRKRDSRTDSSYTESSCTLLSNHVIYTVSVAPQMLSLLLKDCSTYGPRYDYYIQSKSTTDV